MARPQLDAVRRSRQLRSLRIVAVLRLNVVAGMFVALLVGVTPRWRLQLVLLSAYLVVALCSLVMAFWVREHSRTWSRVLFGLVIVDLAVIVGYKQLSPAGAYIPLLVMTLLPMLVVFDVSRRRAATVLTVTAVAFAGEVFADPLLVRTLGWGRPTLVVMFYVLLCVTSFLAVQVQTRHVDEIAALTVSREEMLGEVMSAADQQQRAVSEYVHDGPLQYVLAARQEIASLRKQAAEPRLDHALGNLQDAIRQLREVIFELHPAVLEHVGLAAAVAELASVNAARAGISIATDLVEYPCSDPLAPLVFGVARELMSNIVRHAQATHASVKLKRADGVCCLEVEDDGVGISEQEAARRLAGGHIGLASHRARVEAAGGAFTIQPLSPGTRISVTVPLRA